MTMSIEHSFPRLGRIAAMGRLADSWKLGLWAIAALHLAALAVLLTTEKGWLGPALFVLCWAFLNSAFLLALRRPGVSAAMRPLTIGNRSAALSL